MKFHLFFSYRKLNLIGFLLCIFSLCGAIYLQLYEGLLPCPLCIMQRLVMVLLAFLFLIGSLHTPQPVWRRSFGVVLALVAIGGIAIAGRHVWLERLPLEQLPSCGASLEYLWHNMSLWPAFKLMLVGTGQCGRDNWTFLALSLPMWSLVFFCIYLSIAIIQIIRKKYSPSIK